MRTIKILTFFLLLVSMSLQAQIREDVDFRSGGRPEISKLVTVYPNPAVDVVNIRFTQFPASHVKVTLHNIIGNEIPVEIETVDENELRLKVKELAPGYYLIVLKNPQERFQGTLKIVKK